MKIFLSILRTSMIRFVMHGSIFFITYNLIYYLKGIKKTAPLSNPFIIYWILPGSFIGFIFVTINEWYYQ